MSEFTEQLDAIARLRAEAREHDEAVYAARVRLQQVNQRLGRAARQQTVTAPDRDRDVAGLRASLATLNARLGQLREEAREIGRELDAIDEQQRILQHLQQNLAAARRRAESLRARLAGTAAATSRAAGGDRSDRGGAGVAGAIGRAARGSHRRRHRAFARTGAARARSSAIGKPASDREMNSLRADLQGVQQVVADRQQPAFEDADAIRAEAKELQATAGRRDVAAVRAKKELGAAIAGLYARDPHPRVPLARLDDRIPFLLFPVRIETIFAPQTPPRGVAGTELRVRIYPDHFVVHTHEATLTDREVDAGQLYWVELVVAAHLRGGARAPPGRRVAAPCRSLWRAACGVGRAHDQTVRLERRWPPPARRRR